LVGLVAYDGIKQSREFSSSSAMMNTAVSADIEGKDAKKVGKAVFDCISELENKLLSRHIETSAVSEINDAAGQSVKITLFSSSANGKINDPEKKMRDILSKCEELRKSSGGAFDPLLGRLSDLWGFGTGNERVPGKDEINSALNGTGSAIEINENGIKIPSGTVLDLGSVGKGIAATRCASARKFKNKARGRLRRREHTSLRRGRKIHCRDKRSFFGELDRELCGFDSARDLCFYFRQLRAVF